MAERLFQGQLRPQAQPISRFINPQQFRRAGAAQQPLLGRVSQIATQQQAGTSGVKGFNQFEQMATALAPLSKGLTSLADKGFKRYAKGSIEAGYYEAMRNEQIQGVMNLQQNQEAGAAEAASMIGKLEKTDPVAGALLRDANPWKAIGRRRALAQLAAGQVSSVLNADLENNASAISAIRPGSPQLRKRKQELTQQVYQQFGLTGNEPEATYYVTPVMNKSWDRYTQVQSKLYGEEVYESSITATVAATVSGLDKDEAEGIVLDSGERVFPGDERFDYQAGKNMTDAIDKGLSLLAGEDKAKAMKEINKNLGLIKADNPVLGGAIDNILVGPAGDKNRPRWIDANPFELRNYTNDGLKLINSEYREKQESVDARLDNRWNETLGQMTYDSPEYQQELKNFEAFARESGKGDVEGWIQDRIKEDRDIAVTTGGDNPLSTEERFAFDDALNDLTPDTFQTREGTKAIYRYARDMARREPTASAAWKAYQGYVKRIRAKQAEFASLPDNSRLDATISEQLKFDLNQPGIRELKGSLSGGSFATFDVTQATTDQEQVYIAFSNDVRQLITNESFALIREWQNKNPGLEIPIEEVRRRIRTAAKNVRETPEYEASKQYALSELPPSGTDDKADDDKNKGSDKSNQPVDIAPVNRGQGATITPEQAKQYKGKALMTADWIFEDLDQISTKYEKGISPETKALADKAGVHPYRLLQQQLKIFSTENPQLDPDGKVSDWLKQRLKDIKEGTTSAVPYGLNREIALQQRAPGAWLTAMTLPVQVVHQWARVGVGQRDVLVAATPGQMRGLLDKFTAEGLRGNVSPMAMRAGLMSLSQAGLSPNYTARSIRNLLQNPLAQTLLNSPALAEEMARSSAGMLERLGIDSGAASAYIGPGMDLLKQAKKDGILKADVTDEDVAREIQRPLYSAIQSWLKDNENNAELDNFLNSDGIGWTPWNGDGTPLTRQKALFFDY